MIYTALIVIVLIVSVLLVLVILAQNAKGGGVSSQFGGAGATQMVGAKKTTDLLERVTWSFAATILVFVLFSNFFIPKQNPNQGISSPNVEKAKQKKINAPTPNQDKGTEKPTSDSKTGTPKEEKK